MSLKLFPEHIEKASTDVNRYIEKLEAKWNQTIDLKGNFSTIDETIYDCYPYLFKDFFPEIGDEQFLLFSVAGRLFSGSVISYDSLIDNPFLKRTAKEIFSLQAMQWEANLLLNKFFSPEALFWERFREFISEHVWACSEEQKFHNHQKCWKTYSEQLALDIAAAKNGISKTVIAGLASLSGDEALYVPLIESVNHFNIFCQMLDDFTDWKKDLESEIPSLLLGVLFREENIESGIDQMSEKERDTLSKKLYYGKTSEIVFQIGITSIENAIRETVEIGGKETEWHTLLLQSEKKIKNLAADFQKIKTNNIERVKTQPSVSINLNAPTDEWRKISQTSLEYLIEQWHKGFGEVKHIMYLTSEEGFNGQSNSEYYHGDVFQRALILDTFCKAQAELGVSLEPIIEHEVDYLLNKRTKDEIGGWKYFPEISEIASDTDDLGQILQALTFSDHKELALTYCEKPIKVVLNNNFCEDGGVETWIVPKNNRTPLQEKQSEYNLTRWGIGPDNEVVANFFYGLYVYDFDRFQKAVMKGSDYVEKNQNSDGSWDSRWYFGKYYGTYACSRLLRKTRQTSNSLKLAENFIIKSQNNDGGWGNKQSDQLNTSLALLALAYSKNNTSKDSIEISQKALTFLQHSLENNKKWEKVEFIKPRMGEAYASRTITAMFACKAALKWEQIHKEMNL